MEQLSEACAKLIEDGELRFALGEKGRDSVVEKFAPETMVSVIENVYNHLMEGEPLGADPTDQDETPAAG